MTDETVSNQKHLPDPEICRTRYLVKSIGFTECLAKNPAGCEFAGRFASFVSCLHPHRRKFEKAAKP